MNLEDKTKNNSIGLYRNRYFRQMEICFRLSGNLENSLDKFLQ